MRVKMSARVNTDRENRLSQRNRTGEKDREMEREELYNKDLMYHLRKLGLNPSCTLGNMHHSQYMEIPACKVFC